MTSPQPKRKRGAPPGNTNALKHGYYSKKLKQSYLNQLAACSSDPAFPLGTDVKSIRAALYTVLDHCPQDLTPPQAVALLRAVTQAGNTIVRFTRPSS